MLTFLRVKTKTLDEVPVVKDQILYDDDTGYLYSDFYDAESDTVTRQVVNAPSAAENVTYDNTDSELDAEDVQSAIDLLAGSYEVIEFHVNDTTGILEYTTGNATASTGNGGWEPV